MAEEYNQAAAPGMCAGGGGGGGSGNWWDSSRARFDSGSSTSSTSLSATGSYGWLTEAVDINTRSTMDSASSTSSSAVFPDPHKLQGANSATTAAMLLDPNLQIMGLGLSSQAMDWNPPLLRNEKAAAESSFRSMLQEGMGANTNFNQETGGGAFGTQVQWRTTSEKLFPGISSEESTEYKQINRGFSLDQPMESHFHLESSSIYSSPSSILQGLIGSDQQQQQKQQQSSSQYENRPIGYGYNQQQPNYGLPSHDSMMPPWSKNIPQFLRASTPKQPPMAPSPHAQLHFTNTAQFWNAPVASATAISDPGRLSFFPSLQTQVPMPTFDEKPKIKQNALEVRETVKKSGGDQTTNKRPRNEASSTLPPFKVRKEKMGDRITALQQLVSPFGKTDTASVLSEAIEYIKFLHEQISVLSNPYLKSGASLQLHQSGDKSKDPEGPKQDLRSRGLCLVPVSTFPVAHETTVDFWTPTFGGSFR